MERNTSAATTGAIPAMPAIPTLPLQQGPLPLDFPNVVRPSYAPSLEIFNRPPSPDVTDMLQALGRRPKTSVRILSGPSQRAVNEAVQLAGNAEASGSGNAPAPPRTPIKISRSTRQANGAQTYDLSAYTSPSHGLMPASTIASLSGSPYVRKTVKLGSKKGKGKAVEEHVVSTRSVGCSSA